MPTKAKYRFEDLPKDYDGLCRVLTPRKIHDQVEYGNVTEITDAMALWRDDFSGDQADYFELLCAIIEDYDAAHVKWPKVTGAQMLKHLMDERDMSAADLSRLLGGSRNLGAMILRGERNLTVEHIGKLAAHFKVSPAVFIGVEPEKR